MHIRGICALVTGAASGLGRGVAEHLHAAGALVVLVDRDADGLERVAQPMGERASAFRADVVDPEQVERALSHAGQQFGGVRVVVNCAGIASSAKVIANNCTHEWELWRRVIDVNLTGTFYVTALAALHMSRNAPDQDTGERGVIVNTASIAAFDGQRGQAAYAASKAGVAGMTLPIARDLADKAIRCVALAPGLFDTPLIEGIPAKGREALERAMLFPRRPGRVDEFAALVAHVIENTYLNAACVRLDGGARLT